MPGRDPERRPVLGLSMVWTGHSHVFPMESVGSDFSLAVICVRS